MREETVEVDDGAGLWTVTEGDGPPVVLCHGGPGGTGTLAPLARVLVDRCRVHRYEQRACGRSCDDGETRGEPTRTSRRSSAGSAHEPTSPTRHAPNVRWNDRRPSSRRSTTTSTASSAQTSSARMRRPRGASRPP